MMLRKIMLVGGLLVLTLLLRAVSVSAHQPWFEDSDFTAESPRHIPDATISTALYATLESADDRDYYTFDASAGEDVLLEMTIPMIEGQESFAPTIVVFGPGLAAEGYEIPPASATVFNEPFSDTSYWDRQEEWVTIPEGGRYTAVVSHPTGETGRYVFVVGSREVRGGDQLFRAKLGDYWTPFVPQVVVPTATPIPPTPMPTSLPPTPTPVPTEKPIVVPSAESAEPQATSGHPGSSHVCSFGR